MRIPVCVYSFRFLDSKMDRATSSDRRFAVLSEKIFKTSLGVAITAGALGFGLFLGSAGPSRAQDKAATPAAPQAKDQKEFDEASAASKENTDFKKKLALLDTWKKDYPTTALVTQRHGMYLETYLKLQMARETFDQALEILNKDNPAENAKLIPMVYAIQMLPGISRRRPRPTWIMRKRLLGRSSKIRRCLLRGTNPRG